MRDADSADWLVLRHRAALMQRLADLVRGGHRHYVTGSVSRDKAARLAAKFVGLYQVDQHRMQASRRRSAGQAAFRLLMHAQPGAGEIGWWLLRSDGAVPAEALRERWRDALVERLVVGTYELVRQTRPGARQPAWTWRYTADQERALRDACLRAIRNGRGDELRQLIDTLHRTPGFAGARTQVKRLRDLIESEWLRLHRHREPVPEMPARLGYVQRLPDIGWKLSEFGRRRRAHRA